MPVFSLSLDYNQVLKLRSVQGFLGPRDNRDHHEYGNEMNIEIVFYFLYAVVEEEAAGEEGEAEGC